MQLWKLQAALKQIDTFWIEFLLFLYTKDELSSLHALHFE